MVNALIAAPLLTLLFAAGLYVTDVSPWAVLAALLFGAPVIFFLAWVASTVAACFDDRAYSGGYRPGKTDKPVEVDR